MDASGKEKDEIEGAAFSFVFCKNGTEAPNMK
jgi:hypothetical protein